jgi:putative transcriptional regulator
MAVMRFLWRSVLLATAVLMAHADPLPSILLVSKPGLADPNFRETVVLVTRTAEAQTVGVILNRPTRAKLFFGGPVMPRTPVALFRSPHAPPAAAFEVAKDIYLTMHPDNIARLGKEGAEPYRIYTGFSGWAPGQLESEIEREGWYVLPVREEVLFRPNTEGLWRELLDQATGERAEQGRRNVVAILAP